MHRSLSLVTFGLLVAVALALFASTFSDEYDLPAFGGDVSTVFMPRVFLAVWIVLSGLAFWETLAAPRDGGEGDRPKVALGQLLTVMAIAVATAVGMLTVGFLLALVPGFFLFCWAFGYRRVVPLAVISLLGPVGTWLLFIHLFELPLPQSPWFTQF